MAYSIDYYFSIVSPWSYIGHPIFVALARRQGASIVYKPVELPEVFEQTGGLPLARRHPARRAYREMEMKRWRDKRGLFAFNLWPRHWPFDAAPVNRAIVALAASGKDPDPFIRLAFGGVWEREENLADPAVISELLNRAGFDGARDLELAGSEETAALFERNRTDAVAAGVFGAPSYVVEGEVFWGQDRLDLLEDRLSSRRASYA